MRTESIKIRAERGYFGERIDLYAFSKSDGITSQGLPLVMETIPNNNARISDPTISIGKDEAQLLMDDLWQAGIRPSEGSGSAGSLRATEKHLNDMRKIVENKLGVEFK